MERECANIKSALINSNEFVYSTPKDLGKNVIVCLSCHKGNTPETINAAKLAKEKGAAVIILTWKEESELPHLVIILSIILLGIIRILLVKKLSVHFWWQWNC